MNEEELEIEFIYDKGYQDKIRDFQSLSIFEQLNIVADKWAKLVLWKVITNDNQEIPLCQSPKSLEVISIDTRTGKQ